MQDAYEQGATCHPQAEMKKLGITYQHATPQSIGDQWWFWNCQCMPDPIPNFLSIMGDLDPMEMVGFGLSIETAESIRDFNPATT